MKISRLVCLVAVLCSGCALGALSALRGRTAKLAHCAGANVERSHGIPAYFGPPPRRYQVIGMIDATTAPVRSEGYEFAGTFNTATAVMKWQALTGEIMEPAAKLLPICCQSAANYCQ